MIVEMVTTTRKLAYRRHYEIITVTRIPRINDEIPQSRPQSDHFRGDHYQPSDTETDSHAGDDMGQGCRYHYLTEERQTGHAEVLGCPNILSLDAMNSGCRFHDNRKD